MQNVAVRLRRVHQDERGANMFITLAIGFGLLLLVPIFVDFASLHFSHRVAQTGADTAAHAAAVEYSYNQWFFSWLPAVPAVGGDLSGTFSTLPCASLDPTGQDAAELYFTTVVVPTAWNQRGQAAAASYASRHKSRLVDYDQRLYSHTGYIKGVQGVPIPAIEIYGKVRHPTPIIYEQLYGGDYLTPGEANAEVYLDDYTWQVTACPFVPPEPPTFTHVFFFRWKVRLIDTVRF